MRCELYEQCEGGDCICNLVQSVMQLDSKGGDHISASSLAEDDVSELVSDCAEEGTGALIIIVPEGFGETLS